MLDWAGRLGAKNETVIEVNRVEEIERRHFWLYFNAILSLRMVRKGWRLEKLTICGTDGDTSD